MKKRIQNLFPFALVCLILFTACGEKTTPPPADAELQTSYDNAFASSEFSSIKNIVDLEAINDSVIYKAGTYKIDGLFCPDADVTVTSNGVTATLVIDFKNGTTCLDGRLRSGTLSCLFTGKWKDAGTSVQITPNNYTVNTFAVSFQKTITNNGNNANGNPQHTVTIQNGMITTASGTINYEANRVTEQTAGVSTPLDHTDNEYSMTGTASGTSRLGRNFTMTIDQPLIAKATCPNFVQGIFTLSPDGGTDRVVDYGDGTCDNTATLTIGNWSTTLNLEQ